MMVMFQLGWRMSSEVTSSDSYSFLDVHLVIEFDEDRCMDLIGVLPSVITFRVTLPFDQILQGLVPPPGPVGTYLLHFIFRFTINQIRWWSGEIWAM
jgi:hypothetical protein